MALFTFRRPVGAKADLQELEYVSALHQTTITTKTKQQQEADADTDEISKSNNITTNNKGARRDGSITAYDIQLFLKSRYGIDVELEVVKTCIVKSLGGAGDGSDNQEEEDVIDLAEIASLLLIPTILKTVVVNNSSQDDNKEDSKDNNKNNDLDLIRHVWTMILRDTTGYTTSTSTSSTSRASSSTTIPKLTTSLLRDILTVYGEQELANDDELLNEIMIQVTTGTAGRGAGGGYYDGSNNEGGDGGLLFTSELFAKALTSDLSLYDINNDKPTAAATTNYEDVMMADTNDKTTKTASTTKNMNEMNQPKHSPTKFHKLFSTAAIDFTACRYSSKLIVVLLWAGFIISYIAYFAILIRENADWMFNIDDLDDSTSNNNYYGQVIGTTILEWLFILATLYGFGFAYVGMGSCGNGIDGRQWTRVFAVAFIAIFTWMFFLALYNRTDRQVGEVTTYDETTGEEITVPVISEQSQPYEVLVYMLSLILGNLALLLEAFFILGSIFNSNHCCCSFANLGQASKNTIVKFFTATGVKSEVLGKQAAEYKVQAMVDNAREIHSQAEVHNEESSFGAALLRFSVQGTKYQDAGGFLWTWKKILNNELFCQEGVMISSRVLAGNLSQLLMSTFVLTFGIAFTRRTVEAWQEQSSYPEEILIAVLGYFNVQFDFEAFTNNTCNYMTNSSLSGIVDLNFTQCSTIANDAIITAVLAVSDGLYPQEQYMIEVPLIVATVMAFATCLALIATVIPSTISTTLCFRTGVIAFFRDEDSFALYRSRLDQITGLLGSMFWSALYASAFIGGLFALIVFAFLWQATSYFFLGILALLIAIISTIIIKILIAVTLLRCLYVGFYRKKVNQANIVSLAQECVMVGFAVGTALARAIKLVLISALYIGRVDTPLLAPGVGVGPLQDRHPTIFRQDILSLEAHRHPYLERLGKMYLMKLQLGDRFANKAGYCLRLVFTLALMPWLREYRVLARAWGETKDDEDKTSSKAAVFRRDSLLQRAGSVYRPDNGFEPREPLDHHALDLQGIPEDEEVAKLTDEPPLLSTTKSKSKKKKKKSKPTNLNVADYEASESNSGVPYDDEMEVDIVSGQPSSLAASETTPKMKKKKIVSGQPSETTPKKKKKKKKPKSAYLTSSEYEGSESASSSAYVAN